MAADDQRAAVGFSVTLSSQLIAASMAMLAVETAYLWYALGSRTPRTGFVIFAVLAALAIVASIFLAGKGITKARNAGFVAKWDLAAGKQEFDRQAKLLIAALLMLFVTFALSGPARESALERKVDDLTIKVAALREELNKLQVQPRIEVGPQPTTVETPKNHVLKCPQRKVKRKRSH